MPPTTLGEMVVHIGSNRLQKRGGACLESDGPLMDGLSREVVDECIVEQEVHIRQECGDVVDVCTGVQPSFHGGEVHGVGDFQGVLRIYLGIHWLQERVCKLQQRCSNRQSLLLGLALIMGVTVLRLSKISNP